MSIHRRFALILAVLWLWPASLHAQSEALTETFQQGRSLYEAGRYEQAIPLWRKALELGEQEYGPVHTTTANLLNNLAQLYHSQGRYEAAEPLYKQALAIREKVLGPDHPDVTIGLNNLAGLSHTLGPDHPNVAQSLNNLAGLYHAQGRYEASEPLYKQALAVWEKAVGPDHPNVATALKNYAGLLRKTGRDTEAAEMETRAKEIRAKHAEENP